MNHIFPTADAHWASVCKKRKATDNAHDMVAGLEDLGRLNAHASRADRHVIVRDARPTLLDRRARRLDADADGHAPWPVDVNDRPIRSGAAQARSRSPQDERLVAVDDVAAGQQLDDVAGVERSLQLGELVCARRPDRGRCWSLEWQRRSAGAIAGVTEVLCGQQARRIGRALESSRAHHWLVCRVASRCTAAREPQERGLALTGPTRPCPRPSPAARRARAVAPCPCPSPTTSSAFQTSEGRCR